PARRGRGGVIREAAYAGESGVIRLFEARELDRLTAGDVLFDAPVARKKKAVVETKAAPAPEPPRITAAQADACGRAPGGSDLLGALDADQRAAAGIVDGALAIIAGPASGKTRTLTLRIPHPVALRRLPPPQRLPI